MNNATPELGSELTDLAIELDAITEEVARDEGHHLDSFNAGALFALGYVFERLGLEGSE